MYEHVKHVLIAVLNCLKRTGEVILLVNVLMDPRVFIILCILKIMYLMNYYINRY